jgi:nucleoside-diphosphate-sugar epimerase
MKTNILICGATGFIGRNFLESFSKIINYKIYATYNKKKKTNIKNVKWIKADLTTYKDCLKATKNKDIILQFAAMTSGSNVILAQPYLHITDNAVMNSYILKASYHNKIKHFIFTSCTVMYPNSKKALKETELEEDKIHQSYFGAAHTKLYIEKMCNFFSKISSTRFTIIRHSNIYGPHDKFDIKTGHFISSSFKKILNRGSEIEVFGSGEEKRDYLYITDLINFVKKVINKQKSNFEIINCSYGESFKISQVLKKILKISKSKKKIKKINKKNINIDILVSNKKAKKLLNWSPNVTLESGLKKTFSWLKKS